MLTIDHVFRIIGSVASEGKTWKDALLETLPERKGATELHKPDSENSCDNDSQNTP